MAVDNVSSSSSISAHEHTAQEDHHDEWWRMALEPLEQEFWLEVWMRCQGLLKAHAHTAPHFHD